jgi:aryl-alcohol dehydrogenase-like predicted oxidoreductase
MLNERGFRILAALDAVAGEYDATPAQVALAWLCAHGITAPIASATSLVQVEELVGFADIELRSDAVARLDAASEGGAAPPAW